MGAAVTSGARRSCGRPVAHSLRVDGYEALGVDGVIVEVQIVALLASPVHAYEGRPADGPRGDPTADAR